MQIFCVLLLLSMKTFQDILLREISNTLFITVHDVSLTGTGYGEGKVFACFVSGLYQEKLEFALSL